MTGVSGLGHQNIACLLLIVKGVRKHGSFFGDDQCSPCSVSLCPPTATLIPWIQCGGPPTSLSTLVLHSHSDPTRSQTAVTVVRRSPGTKYERLQKSAVDCSVVAVGVVGGRGKDDKETT